MLWHFSLPSGPESPPTFFRGWARPSGTSNSDLISFTADAFQNLADKLVPLRLFLLLPFPAPPGPGEGSFPRNPSSISGEREENRKQTIHQEQAQLARFCALHAYITYPEVAACWRISSKTMSHTRWEDASFASNLGNAYMHWEPALHITSVSLSDHAGPQPSMFWCANRV